MAGKEAGPGKSACPTKSVLTKARNQDFISSDTATVRSTARADTLLLTAAAACDLSAAECSEPTHVLGCSACLRLA